MSCPVAHADKRVAMHWIGSCISCLSTWLLIRSIYRFLQSLRENLLTHFSPSTLIYVHSLLSPSHARLLLRLIVVSSPFSGKLRADREASLKWDHTVGGRPLPLCSLSSKFEIISEAYERQYLFRARTTEVRYTAKVIHRW